MVTKTAGRTAHERAREVAAIHTNSDGYAEIWDSPSLRVACAVNGPIEARLRDEIPTQATLEIVYRRNIGRPKIREQLIQDRLYTCALAIIRRDLLPRSLIQIVVQLLESFTKPKSACFVAEISESVNCMSLALARCGVPLKGLVVSRSYFIDANGGIWPSTATPTAEITSTHAFAFTYINRRIAELVMAESSGEFSKQQLVEAIKLARADSETVAAKLAARINRI